MTPGVGVAVLVQGGDIGLKNIRFHDHVLGIHVQQQCFVNFMNIGFYLDDI